MSKWRIWRDEFRGDDWNDRQEISYPESEGQEIPDSKVEDFLKNLFPKAEQKYVKIDGDEDILYARLDYCTCCGKPLQRCRCPESEPSIAGYHAERQP